MGYKKKEGSGAFIFKWDPRVKIAALFVYLVFSLQAERILPLLLSLGFVVLLALLGRVSLWEFIRRLSLLILFGGFLLIFYPFLVPGQEIFAVNLGPLGADASLEGFYRGVVLLLRLAVSLAVLTVLLVSTGPVNIFKALEDLRVPGLFLRTAEFTLRYFYLCTDELKTMITAQKARGFEPAKSLLNIFTMNTLSHLIGMLFLRTYKRGERVYTAMLSRGYTGEFYTLSSFSPQISDYLLGVLVSAAGIAIFLFDKGAV
ncbi:MAG: Cobalt ABC transporter, inner membrane subunit CbiQ [Clostridia bacterium 41_269]|nr:MAG: Cobalt ABC transporter, inner membrane subunit CbiQ [Clostridia bacterium 41_269]